MCDEPDFCLICGKRLKKLIHEEFKMAYHKKCFNQLIGDLKNFDEKLAIKKYSYKPLYNGKTKEEIENGAEIVLTFD
tara:strand:- start:791 stop:1021 length:231 start_codon:yes stop_codon:yes gene_type:complete